MPVTDFTVSASDVLPKLPGDYSNITSSTAPVSTSDLDAYIDEASAEIANALDANGISASDVKNDPDRLETVQRAIKFYAAAEALDRLGAIGEEYERFRSKWRDIRKRIEGNDDFLNPSADTVYTNIQDQSDSDKPDPEFIDVNYEW